MEKRKGTTKERMKEVLQVLGVSAYEFENRCGLSHGFVSRVTHEITKKTRMRIKAAYPTLNIDYIARGVGEMFIKEGEAMTTIKERIIQFYGFMDISKRDFIRRSGISDAFIQNMSENVRHSSLEKIYRAFPMLNPEWLEYGDGEMLQDAKKKKTTDTASDRIEKLIAFLGTTSLTFDTETGISTRKDNITKKTVDKIVRRYPFVNPLWLMHGTGTMIVSAPKPVRQKFLYAPLIPQRAFAGYLAGFEDDEYMDSLDKIPYIEDEETRGNVIAIEISGDSMDDGTSEAYVDGDIVLAKEIFINDPLPYKRYDFVIVHKSGILIKRIVKEDRERGTLTIHSLNRNYGDAEIDMNDVLKIFIVTMKMTRKRR